MGNHIRHCIDCTPSSSTEFQNVGCEIANHERVLKYAPLKSEFVRKLVQDETIKNGIDADMYMVEPTYIDEDLETVGNADAEN